MGVVNYLTVNGEILSETRNGVERDYMPDPLGSTAALLDSSGITDTFSYWPYGEVRSHTGSSTTPFQYVGTFGYYTDIDHLYVRARYLPRWLTVDPLWPKEKAYSYVRSNPTSRLDVTGTRPLPIWWFPECRRKGSPGPTPITIWLRPCQSGDAEVCDKQCQPIGEGKTVDIQGECECFCVPVWIDCSATEIIACMKACRRFGLSYLGCSIDPGKKFSYGSCKCGGKAS